MNFSRRNLKRAALAALLFLGTTGLTRAEDTKSALSTSGGLTFTSHFISFGADVWGGGGDLSPFSAKSTAWVYGTLTAAINDHASVYINIWSDNNDNVHSGLGGPVQEIDVNIGGTYKIDKFTLGLAHNYWMYGGSEERALEFSVAYDDSELIGKKLGFSLAPSALIHYRYNGIGAQDESAVIQLGVGPSWSFNSDGKYPVSLTVPAAIGIFTDKYQGGDSGLGYVNIGAVGSVPLKFVPAKFGAWNASASATLWYTPKDQIPGNPEETFVVTGLSVGVSY